MCVCKRWSGLDWTGLDWTGLVRSDLVLGTYLLSMQAWVKSFMNLRALESSPSYQEQFASTTHARTQHTRTYTVIRVKDGKSSLVFAKT